MENDSCHLIPTYDEHNKIIWAPCTAISDTAYYLYIESTNLTFSLNSIGNSLIVSLQSECENGKITIHISIYYFRARFSFFYQQR